MLNQSQYPPTAGHAELQVRAACRRRLLHPTLKDLYPFDLAYGPTLFAQNQPLIDIIVDLIKECPRDALGKRVIDGVFGFVVKGAIDVTVQT